MGAAHRIIPTNVKRVYYCAEGGGYHFTGSEKESRKQRQSFEAEAAKVIDEENDAGEGSS